MKKTNEELNRRSTSLGVFCLVLFIGGVMLIAACCGTKSEAKNPSPISTEKYNSVIPQDGKPHILYVDPSGDRIMGMAIQIGNSYGSHIIWLETDGGSIYKESISTH